MAARTFTKLSANIRKIGSFNQFVNEVRKVILARARAILVLKKFIRLVKLISIYPSGQNKTCE